MLSFIRHLWHLKTVVFLHWCLICTVLFLMVFSGYLTVLALYCQYQVSSCISSECLTKKYTKTLLLNADFHTLQASKVNHYTKCHNTECRYAKHRSAKMFSIAEKINFI